MQLTNAYAATNYVTTFPPTIKEQNNAGDGVESIWGKYISAGRGADLDLWELYESAQRLLGLHPMDPLARTLVRSLKNDLCL